jgi:hypothetical protein
MKLAIKRVTLAVLFNLALVSASYAQGSPALSQKSPDAVPAGATGMKVYIDPQTGAILSEPAPGSVPLQMSPQEQNALSTSSQDLVQIPSSEPGGGVKLDLQGRFQSPLIATIDANGKVKIEHLGEMPESGDKK